MKKLIFLAMLSLAMTGQTEAAGTTDSSSETVQMEELSKISTLDRAMFIAFEGMEKSKVGSPAFKYYEKVYKNLDSIDALSDDPSEKNNVKELLNKSKELIGEVDDPAVSEDSKKMSELIDQAIKE